MKKTKRVIKRSILFFTTMILMVFTVNNYFCESKNNYDLFGEILNKTQGEIIECGVTTSFETKEDGKTICNSIYKDININIKAKELKNDKLYCLEFVDDKIQGYIQSLKSDGNNVITINIVQKSSENKLNELKDNVQKAICKVKGKSENKYFSYLKAQIRDEDLSKVNKSIMQLLKQYDVRNMSTIHISNGYNTTAYTGKYDVIKVNDAIIDFNYSVCRYTSGNYLIMGTPEIIINY